MENASKALVIAGAILLAILLISVALLIFNSTKGTTNQAVASGDYISLEATIAKIDMQFSKYNGIQNTETVVNMLYEAAEYNKNNGSYNKKGDEDTTKLRRKIAVSIDSRIAGKHWSTTGGYGSEDSVNVMVPAYVNYVKNYSEKNGTDEFIIETEKVLDSGNGDDIRDYIYFIRIKNK